MQAPTPGNLLEPLFCQQVHRHRSHVFAARWHTTIVGRSGHAGKGYKFLASAVRQHIDHRGRDETRDGLHPAMPHSKEGFGAGGAGRDSRGGGMNCKKGACRSWTSNGSCPRGSDCPFAHDPGARAPEGKRKGGDASPPRRAEGRRRAWMRQNVFGAAGEGAVCTFYLQRIYNKGGTCEHHPPPKALLQVAKGPTL